MLSWNELAPEVRHFEFEAPAPESFEFTPGQFVSIIEHVDGKEITRAYSIASPRHGNRFALCLNRVPDGLVSSYLFTLSPGDEVEMHKPLGYFTLRHPGRRAVFIATGTGIAPFRSMLLDHLPKTQPRITLLFGVRYERGLLYRSEFEQLEAQYESFRFLPTITRPDSNWKGRTGRVQAHIDEALALHTPEELSTLDVYICGLKEMVDDVRKELKGRGFDRKQIIYEKYD
ncbi:MAG TPA: FAD-binding oxidoreductase [Bryobacteraceae bacterium]|nr:FAD-binding oxidoreductase [Bryobacteraceae bacterium]